MEEFWQRASRNVQERKLRLLFVADVIPTELQRIVEFLNDQMDQTEVLAIEIKQFVSPKGLKSLAPRVVGQTVKALEKKETKSRGPNQDETTFFENIQKTGSAEAGVARQLLEWAMPIFSRIKWGRSSFTPVFDFGADYTHNPLTVYMDGKVEIQFHRMMKRARPFDQEQKRLELLQRINAIPGVSLPTNSITKFPRFSMSPLNDPKSLEQFKKAIEWTVEEVISNSSSNQDSV